VAQRSETTVDQVIEALAARTAQRGVAAGFRP
jgi:hypothetical protein